MKKKNVRHGDDFLYHQISGLIATQIQRFTLRTGDKLPSLRAFSKEQGISLTTAYKAYSELEINSLIEARPKSGYFVRYTPVRAIRSIKSISQTPAKKESDPDALVTMLQQNFARQDMVKLSLATPDISLLPQAKLNKSMVEALRASADSCILYEDIQGFLALRKHIARQAINWGGSITEEDVVTTQGCMEALVYSLKAVTSPGDLIAIESPTYFGVVSVISSLGLRTLEIPADPTTGIDIAALKNELDKNRISACLFVPTFSNPMGYCMSNERKKELVRLLLKYNVPLIEDDIYGEMYFGKARPKTCKSFDEHGMVLLCSSVSKSLAPGYRIGWCLPGRFKDAVIKLKLSSTISSATPTQHAIARFFQTGRYDLHMRNLRRTLHSQCLRYTQAIADYFPQSTKVSRPPGGYVLWLEFSPSVNVMDIFYLAAEAHISIAPGQLFSRDSSFTNYMRISFGIPYNQVIDDSLKLLGNMVKNQLVETSGANL